ncbi:hypothetical protein ACFY9A_19245 [Streptomyces rubradiris]|uniref:hypothetical protein n=1 Tax=Streptomyces rubradiris TaxID=285531 RepID=UPI0036F1211D
MLDNPSPTTSSSCRITAGAEQRRCRQHGRDHRPGTRGGVFRQKTTDGDRILATFRTAVVSAV